MKIIIGNASKELGESVVNRLDVQPSSAWISKFTDGEVNVEVANDLYNQEVYIVQSLSPPVNDNLMELLLIIDAVNRLGAKRIVVIIPYYGYSRQDRIIKNNNMQSALSAKLVANLIQTAGASSVAVIDLHSSQIEGFFDVPITNLNCFEAFVDCIHTENLAIVAPDVGAIGRARAFAKTLEEKYKIGLSDKIIVVDKYREKAGTSQVMNIIGEVANKNCVIVDDIVDSGGTLCNAALALKNCGAKSVISCITHGVLSGSAVEKISSSSLDKLVITDTILHKLEKTGKIEVVSVVDILTHFIQGVKMPAKSTEDVITSLIEFANKRKIIITKEEMLKIAQLVRIKLSNDEIDHYSKELTMLDWIHDTLLQVNTEGVSPMRYGSIDKDIHVRDDVINSQNIKEEILSNTKPEHGYFVVPKVIND